MSKSSEANKQKDSVECLDCKDEELCDTCFDQQKKEHAYLSRIDRAWVMKAEEAS